jgi:hypothetical protein
MAEVLIEEQTIRPVRAQSGRWTWLWLWLVVATLLVLTLGGLEGWYGPTVAGDVYGSDAVQYLDIAHAFERGDLHTALNPLWSQGYPALLAAIRPAFASGPDGEWNAIRALNFAIFLFSWACFVVLVRELLRGRERSAITLTGAFFVFVTTQVCLDQVSRVGPDQLVAALFFLACTLLLRMTRHPHAGLSLVLGIVLGLGFLTKSIFLPLGCTVLLILAAVLWSRARLRSLGPAAACFAVIVLGYGIALSHAVGSATLGEAGSLNYAWHVNRLAKWVHWEGGVDPADKAWPKPSFARFTHWQTDPPDFGKPLHASQVVGAAPAVYVFHTPVNATYAPYFDAPYFYQGYRHLVRWRYQVVALGKNLLDLGQVFFKQAFFWALLLVVLVLSRAPRGNPATSLYGEMLPASALAAAGILIYLPVHLEGRYLAPFLAVLGVIGLESALARRTISAPRRLVVLAILAIGFLAGLLKDQRVVWTRARQHWNYHQIADWRTGAALRREGLAPGSAIGVISWTPNVQCDWAYLAGLRITSEIESPKDERAFWALSPLDQNAVLLNFRQAGAVAVVTRDMPANGASGWQQVQNLPLWIYRFDTEEFASSISTT